MTKLTKEDVYNFAIKKNCILDDNECEFTYNFIKKNWQAILFNKGIFNINKYRNHYSEENFKKIKSIYEEYFYKFAKFL